MPPATPHSLAFSPSKRRWGVVLAGGDGTRLQKLTRLICGDERPKQFCPLIGEDTLLEQTRGRSERNIPADQVLFSLSRSHQAFYLKEPGLRPSQRIVQPGNKGTAPPILHSLLSIERMDTDAIVAMLPCDHYYSDEPMFTAALESAFELAAIHPDSVVMLGARPDGPEVDYGWIELASSGGMSGSFRVRGFREKPSLREARELFRRGCLWNTFVMVGHVFAFLEMIRTALPDLMERFPEAALWSGSEVHIADSIYQRMPAVNFSHDVLSVQTPRLVAQRLGRTSWDDLGHPERVMRVLRRIGAQPWWMKKGRAAKRFPVRTLHVEPAAVA